MEDEIITPFEDEVALASLLNETSKDIYHMGVLYTASNELDSKTARYRSNATLRIKSRLPFYWHHIIRNLGIAPRRHRSTVI
jgi:hypothetical protein